MPSDFGSDAGFATPAAVAISLALATSAAAVMTYSLTALQTSRRDLERTTAAAQLQGASVEAAAALLRSANQGRVRWQIGDAGAAVEIVAEPEARKISLTAAAAPGGPSLDALAPGAGARERLAGLVGRQDQVEGQIAGVSDSPIWRACARSLISPYGEQRTAEPVDVGDLTPGPDTWRTGQVWRLRATSASGWTDDRIVRFTGSPARPVAVIARRFGQQGRLGSTCDAIAGALRQP